jgi:hypothetical protein
MSKEEKLYTEIGESIKGAEQSQMFGKPCFKIKGKAFVCFFQNCMVFKLSGDDHKAAASLDGAELFDPSGKGRPMKEWVQVPFDYSKKWKSFAQSAHAYVLNQVK